MKNVINQLWEVLQTREKSLAVTKKLFEDWLQKEQSRRKLAESVAREFEKKLTLEVEAHRHWEGLFRRAESQRDQERLLRDQEVAAKERCKKHLIRELEAHAHWKKLFFDVEAQRDHEREIRKQEATAKEQAQLLATEEAEARRHWETLFHEAEAQRDQVHALRDEEAAAKEHFQKAQQEEADARQHWEQLFHQAEAQREQERHIREQEAAAKEHAQKIFEAEADARRHWEDLFHKAEAQRDQERSGREQEATAKEHAQKTSKAEADARRHWEDLFHKAESQRDQERKVREQEAAAKELAEKIFKAEAEARRHWEELFHKAETQRDQERAVREQEAEAKGHALVWANAAEAAKEHWKRSYFECEAQRDTAFATLKELRRELDEANASLHHLQTELAQRADLISVRAAASAAGAHLREEQLSTEVTALTVRLAQADFARELAAEQNRVALRRRTFSGRWLATWDAVARVVRTVYCFMRMKDRAPAPSRPGPRITQVNTHDIVGGAERTSYDLHLKFRERGLKPVLIVGGKYGQDADVFKVPFKDIDWKPARIWRDRWGLTEVVAPTPLLGCFQWPELRESQVVHIHNMHGNYWNMATLLPLGMQHPVVLTLHDEYAMTGDCCYTYDCNRWTRSCGKCPRIKLPREARYALGGGDLTRLNVQLKRALLRAPRAYPLVLVAPSRWLADRARRSPNLRHLPVALIHYGIDLEFWRAVPQMDARRALGLPEGKTIGLIVANYVSDPRKGFDVALDAIRRLPAGHNLLFVVAGNIPEEMKTLLAGLPVIAAGFVGDKFKMLNLFSAADFTFSMSRMDNLPYMCIESLACGRPVFGSAVGGIPEIVNDESLGWLASKPFDADAIAATLAQIDREPAAVRAARGAACRRSAEARFDLKVMTERYLALYREMQLAARERRPVDLRRIAPATPLT